MDIRISLDGKAFRELVRGGVVSIVDPEKVERLVLFIALEDIGFGVMRAAIDEAERDAAQG